MREPALFWEEGVVFSGKELGDKPGEIGPGPFEKELWPWDFFLLPNLELMIQQISKAKLEGQR